MEKVELPRGNSTYIYNVVVQSSTYASLLTWRASFDLRLLALFVWMTCVFANMSKIFATPGYISMAAAFSLVARNFLTALRMVFA